MSGAELISSFGQTYTVYRYASSVQIKEITFDADFITGNEITLLVDNQDVGPIAFNGTHSQTLQDLADAIAALVTIDSVAISGARSIELTAADAGNEILIFDIEVSGGGSQASGSISGASGGYVDGDYDDPTPSSFEAVISLQPITGEELLLLSEGNRTRRFLRGYTATRLYTEDEALAQNADRIYYDDRYFEVQQCEKWTPTDLDHYSIVFAEINDEHNSFS